MKLMLIVFFILLFLVLIFLFPFKTRFMCHVNVFDMKGFYSIKIWRFNFICGKIYSNPDGKIKSENSIGVINKEYDKNFVKLLAINFAKRHDVHKVEIFFTGGFKENSYSSAVLCGSVSSMVQSLYSYLTQKYDYVRLYENIVPTFNENNLELTFDIVLSISIFKIFVSIIKSNIANNKFKERKNEG